MRTAAVHRLLDFATMCIWGGVFSYRVPRVHLPSPRIASLRKPAAMLDQLNQWTLKDPIVSQRGAKSCPLTHEDGTAVVVQLGSKDAPVASPFGASSYGDEASVRKTIEFSLDPERAQAWDAVTEWLRGYLLENAERLMKKRLSADTIRENLRAPAVQKNENYPPLLRCKITTAGAHAVRCWDEQGGED